MIYFIQCGKNGPIKIGQSENPVQRMATLQIGNHEKLEMLWQYSGDRYSEQFIHEKFSEHHIRGEWYHPHPEVLLFVSQCLINGRRKELPNETVIITENQTGDISIETNYMDLHVVGHTLRITGFYDVKVVNLSGEK